MSPTTWSRARRLCMCLVPLAVAGTGLVAAVRPAHAQKLYETTRYESSNQPIANWITYGPTGYPAARDPNCPNFAGVRRSSKVWATTYGVDESLHTNFRMQFHTTYSRPVASAILAERNAKQAFTCSAVDAFQNSTAVDAAKAVACGAATNRPNRWCDLAINHPNDPAVNPQLDERCASPAPNGAFWPTSWHEWHNLPDRVGSAARLYWIDVVEQFASWLSSLGLSINMPVYLDDVTIVGGVSNFNQSTAQPAYGNAWYGYGRVAAPGIYEAVAQWYDAAAKSLGKDPYSTPVQAHQAVDKAIAAGRAPRGTANLTRHDFYSQLACPWSPKVADVLDPGGTISLAAIGQDLSGWVQRETGETLCQKVHEQPKFAGVANAACNNTFVGLFFAVVDSNNCMNRPGDPIATLLGVDLGCNRDIHLARLFSQMKAFLGG